MSGASGLAVPEMQLRNVRPLESSGNWGIGEDDHALDRTCCGWSAADISGGTPASAVEIGNGPRRGQPRGLRNG